MRGRIRCRRWISLHWQGGWWQRSRIGSKQFDRSQQRSMPTVLLTGGTGYIASHTCVELVNAGYDTILFDNFCNSSPVVIDRIEKIVGKRLVFVEGNIRDRSKLDQLFDAYPIDV